MLQSRKSVIQAKIANVSESSENLSGSGKKKSIHRAISPPITILLQHQKHPNQILCSYFEYFLQILKLKIDFLPQIEYTEHRKHLGGFAMLLQFSVTNQIGRAHV